jgi:hypothetical protein
MKYQLKGNSEVTCEAPPIPQLSGHGQCVTIRVKDKQSHRFCVDTPQWLFLEMWELVPEGKPPIEHRLREIVDRPDGAIIAFTEVNQACREGAAEIKRLTGELEQARRDRNIAKDTARTLRKKLSRNQGCRPSEDEIDQLELCREALAKLQWQMVSGRPGSSAFPTCMGCGIVSHGALSTPPHAEDCPIEAALHPKENP